VVTDCRLASAGLVIVANLAALGMLSARLVAPSTSGGPLLLGAMQVWITNVIGFGTLRVPDQLRRFQSNGQDVPYQSGLRR
jgi:hypothetical protein